VSHRFVLLLKMFMLLACCALFGGTGAAAQQDENQPAQQTASEQEGEQQSPTRAEIEADALEALSSIEGLDDESVTIQGGSAVVSGVADDPAVVERAEQVVRAAAGVESVQNNITVTHDVGERIRGATTRVSGRLAGFIDALPLVPVALLVVVLAFVLAWLVGKWDWPFRQISRNAFLISIAQRLVQLAVGVLGLLLALEILDATALVGGVLGAAGVAGIAIGFAFRDLVENYIASILLSVRQPFRPHDHVIIDGHEGLVTSMNSRSTVLTTFDGNIVRIPNAVVFKTTIVSYSADPRRRFEFEVGVGYDVDLGEALSIGVEILSNAEGVMQDPKPFGIVTGLGDSSIQISFFGWVDQSKHDFGKVRSAAMQHIKVEFDNRNIDMPEPIYKLRFEGAAPNLSGDAKSPKPGKTSGTPKHHAAKPTPSVAKDETASELADMEARRTESSNLLDQSAPSE